MLTLIQTTKLSHLHSALVPNAVWCALAPRIAGRFDRSRQEDTTG
jgi:hypothetical protein